MNRVCVLLVIFFLALPAISYLDDQILLSQIFFSDDGVLTIAAASADTFTPLAQARVLTGKEAWAPMAMAAGRLLLRDSQRLVCLDMRKEREVD